MKKLCNDCGIEPKWVFKSGRINPYCVSCHNKRCHIYQSSPEYKEYQRKYYRDNKDKNKRPYDPYKRRAMYLRKKAKEENTPMPDDKMDITSKQFIYNLTEGLSTYDIPATIVVRSQTVNINLTDTLHPLTDGVGSAKPNQATVTLINPPTEANPSPVESDEDTEPPEDTACPI